MKVPILRTSRLVLRGILLKDHVAIQKYFPHWDIVKYLSPVVPWPYPKNGAYQWLKKDVLPSMKQGKVLVWGITRKNRPDEVIGVIHVSKKEMDHGHRGFWLAKKFQGRGYMTEAVMAVNEYLFETLKWKRIIVKNAVENKASHRIKEKTGARFLRLKKADYVGGYTHSEVWEVTQKGWLLFKRALI